MGKQGVSTAGMEYSPARAKRKANARKRQDKRWEAKAGPVTVTFVDPATMPTRVTRA
jgi:hypothetical protein